MTAPVLQSCAVGTPEPCDDTFGAEVGVPAWVAIAGAVLLIAAFAAVVVLLLRRATRRDPWR